jgi:hypothetical protein
MLSQTCINTLALRHMVRPFSNGFSEQACPMSTIFAELASSLSELQMLKASFDINMADA